jgi:hypothetical protein
MLLPVLMLVSIIKWDVRAVGSEKMIAGTGKQLFRYA